MTSYNVNLKLGYEGTDFERKMTIPDVNQADIPTETVRGKVNAINASLSGGQADDLKAFFRADDFNASQNVGSLKKITACTINRRDVVDII